MAAIQYADHIVHLQEELPSEDTPPDWVWPIPWELDAHIKKVIAKNKKKYGGHDDGDDEDEEVADMEANGLLPDWAMK